MANYPKMTDPSGEIFLLRRPPENIKVADILATLSGDMFNASPEPVDADREELENIFQSIRRRMDEGINSLNLLQ